MPVDLFGGLGSLAVRGMRLPKLGVGVPSVRTPPTFPSNAGAGTPLPDVSTPQDQDGSGSASIGAAPPVSPTLKQPPMTEGMKQQQVLLDNPPAPAGGVRGKIGGVFNAIGWNWAGNPLKYPGLDVYQANLARAQAKAGLEDEALKRQEAQQRIAESQENMRSMAANREAQRQQQAQAGYERTMTDITSKGGFEAPTIPPSIDRPENPNPLTQIPAGSGMGPAPTETEQVNNLPQRNLILSPGLRPEQSAQLGTVQNVTDPSSGLTTPMVRPNLKTQQEMAQNAMPKVTPEMEAALGEETGLKAGTPVDRTVFNALLKMAAQKNAAPKPEKMDQVFLAIKAAGGDPTNPATVTPEVAKKAAAILKPQQPGVSLTPEAIQAWAQYAATTGQLPSLGMGNAGAGARTQILNAAPQYMGGGNIAGNKATYRADSNSLASAQKMRDSVVAFEKTASKNLDLFTNQAQKVIDSGSPWINQPLRSINRNALGSADQAAFDAARQVALTEIAKVVNNPSLSSVLSDTARREVLSLNPENATLAQINSVAKILKQDMANRRSSLDQQITEIKGRMSPQGNQPKPDPLGIR